jgi:hypothetical protein
LRNPLQFNSILFLLSQDIKKFNVAEAYDETDALLQHLFYHKNTAPFVATRLIQRFGISNPTPRYVRAVSIAFRTGTYTSEGVSFGTRKYGDLSATVAAILLDREARSVILDSDPSHGSLREPILKVISFMRAMEFKSRVPLVELQNMEDKIGQMAYEQESVFSFFRPEYSPPGPATLATLTAPEAEVMTSGNIVGLLNGLFGLVRNGLHGCQNGFGTLGYVCSDPDSGRLGYSPANPSDTSTFVGDLATLLTSGRLNSAKQVAIMQTANRETDPDKAFELALQLLLTTPEFHSTNGWEAKFDSTPSDTAQNPASSSQEGYKVVIHLELDGGCDSFNVLVPHSTCALRTQYDELRDTIKLTDSELLDIGGDTSGQPCSKFSIHHRLTFLKELYDSGDALFIG